MEKVEEIVKGFDEERKKLLYPFSDGDKKLLSDLISELFPLVSTNGFSMYGVSSDDADVRFFEMMTNYSAACKENSSDVLNSIYDAHLHSKKLKASLEANYGFMYNNPYYRMNWLTNKIISDNDEKYELIKELVSREENAPLAADLINKLRSQFDDNNHEEDWVTKEQFEELEGVFQTVSLSALSKKLFLDNHLESHIFFEMKRSSKDKITKFISDILLEDNGVVRVAEIIGYTGTDSTNGPYVEIKDEIVSKVVDMELLREKAQKINLEELPIHLQAVFKSIIDGEKYYLRDAEQAERW